jgi:hypothetical protein
VANHQQLVEHRNRLEALNAAKIVPRFGTDPDPDGEDDAYDFFGSACHSMLEHEDLWKQQNLIWSWIDERPVWLSPINWNLEVLPNPPAPTLRRFSFTLVGGGQIRISEKLERMGDKEEDGFICYEPQLKVTADAGEGLRRFTGIIERVSCEMSTSAVLFLPGTPQSIADRVAATFRLLTFAEGVGTSCRGPDRGNFAALLDRSAQCCVCRRPLKDHVSTLLGIGPDCAKQMGLPHSLDAATKLLQRRRQLLGNAA